MVIIFTIWHLFHNVIQIHWFSVVSCEVVMERAQKLCNLVISEVFHIVWLVGLIQLQQVVFQPATSIDKHQKMAYEIICAYTLQIVHLLSYLVCCLDFFEVVQGAYLQLHAGTLSWAQQNV